MAAGKSTLGFRLAKKLKYKFIDIDLEIEKNEGQPIISIFRDKGEEYFRGLEEKISLLFLNKKRSVISLGGGAFINKKIRKKIKKNSYSFWLNWKIETILNRIKKKRNRPLALILNDKDLNDLFRKRVKFYKLSDFTVNCENKKKSEIVKEISKIIKNENFID